MTTAAKTAGGEASGALSGTYPTPAIGIPPMVGVALWDDFIGESNNFGGSGNDWRLSAPVGMPTDNPITPTTDRELGLHEFTHNVSPRDFHFHFGLGSERPLFAFPIGGIFAVKMCLTLEATNNRVWAGFGSLALVPIPGNTVDFVGIRNNNGASGANWEGVSKNSTLETPIDLGVFGVVDDFNVFGFERLDEGYQFFAMDVSNAGRLVRTNVGDPVSTNNPDQPLTPIFGFETGASGDRGLCMDFYGWGGRFRRG